MVEEVDIHLACGFRSNLDRRSLKDKVPEHMVREDKGRRAVVVEGSMPL